MVRIRASLSGFCMNRAVSRVRVRTSPSQQHRKTNGLIKADETDEICINGSGVSFTWYVSLNQNPNPNPSPDGSEKPAGNKVMVVVDPSAESEAALHWLLSHTLQPQDTIILLHVNKPSKHGQKNERAFEVLRSMKNLCLERRPEVNVEVKLEEGKDKGAVIVEATKRLKVSLLVLGQRKRSLTWRFKMIWSGNRLSNRVADYCIQNANCMTIAVRRKSNKYGGYLITTKHHKNFWLLA